MRVESWYLSFVRKLSQKPFLAKVVRWMIVNFSSLLLREKLYESDHLYVVQHPKPAYQVHYLILPKQPIANVLEVDAESDFWSEVPQAIQILVTDLLNDDEGYRLITNGGAYQDIPLLHIHFISGDTLD